MAALVLSVCLLSELLPKRSHFFLQKWNNFLVINKLST